MNLSLSWGQLRIAVPQLERWNGMIKAIFFVSLVVFSMATAYGNELRQIKTNDGDTLIVFVHGIRDDGNQTWTNDDNNIFWPDLISADPIFDKTDISTFHYSSLLLDGDDISISNVSDQLNFFLDERTLSKYQRIVFIAHSMGGLVVRNLLLKFDRITQKVPLVYFLATPTTGSDIARLAKLSGINNRQLRAMGSFSESNFLEDQYSHWRAADAVKNIVSLCAFETRSTMGVVVVNRSSAQALCTGTTIPSGKNHTQIAKPSGIGDIIHKVFADAMAEILSRKDTTSDFPEMLPLDTSIDFAIEKLGTPSTSLRCRKDGRFFPEPLVNDEELEIEYDEGIEKVNCSTFRHGEYLIDISYSTEGKWIASVSITPKRENLDGLKSDDRATFRKSVPKWMVPGKDNQKIPTTFGEFIDLAVYESCSLVSQGAAGSMSTSGQYAVECHWAGASNKYPGYVAWIHDLSVGEEFLSAYVCYFGMTSRHILDDVNFNMENNNGCNEYGYRSNFDEEQLREWVMNGIRTFQIDGYGRYMP